MTSAWATEVDSWGENPIYGEPSDGTLAAARNDAEITFVNDIMADGWFDPDHQGSGRFPAPLTITSAEDQIIDGNHYSFSTNDVYYKNRLYYYCLDISKTGGSLTLKNLGKVSDGDANNNTFAFTDLDGNTVYKKIDGSVNSWTTYFLTIKNSIPVNIENSVFSNNGKDSDARLIYVSGSGVGTLNVSDSIFYNNTISSTIPLA